LQFSGLKPTDPQGEQWIFGRLFLPGREIPNLTELLGGRLVIIDRQVPIKMGLPEIRDETFGFLGQGVAIHPHTPRANRTVLVRVAQVWP